METSIQHFHDIGFNTNLSHHKEENINILYICRKIFTIWSSGMVESHS